MIFIALKKRSSQFRWISKFKNRSLELESRFISPWWKYCIRSPWRSRVLRWTWHQALSSTSCTVWSAWDRPGSQTPPALVRKCAWPALSDREQFGKDCADVNVGKVVSKWPTGNSKEGGWNMRMERLGWQDITCALQTPWATRVREVCTPRKEKMSEKCARDTECVHTLRRTHSSCHYAGAKSCDKKKILRLSRPTSILISPTRTLSTNLLSTDDH